MLWMLYLIRTCVQGSDIVSHVAAKEAVRDLPITSLLARCTHKSAYDARAGDAANVATVKASTELRRIFGSEVGVRYVSLSG